MSLFIFRLFIYLTLILLTTSCTTYEPRPIDNEQGYKGDEMGISYFTLFKEPPPSGFGMYTYILMGRDVNVGGDIETRQRIDKLLELVLSHTTAEVISEAQKSNHNLFIYPSIREDFKKDANRVDQFDFQKSSELRFSIMDLLENEGSLRKLGISDEQKPKITNAINNLRTQDGPFLVSFNAPFNAKNSTDINRILIGDLSGYPPEAISTIIKEYQHTASDEEIGIIVFDSWGGKILYLIDKIGDAVIDVSSDFLLIKGVVADAYTFD
ncbi:MAG: hypothetical protein MI799_19905 [Desulfobacterales bacterium]|nr:hypothetical protein [Desulfobacterales bacterium]